MERDELCVFLVTKDRPLQTKLLIDSLFTNGYDLVFSQVYALSKYSNDRYKQAYKKLWHDEAVHELLEGPSFRESFLNALEVLEHEHPYILALTDDTVMYRPFTFSVKRISQIFEEYPKVLTVSLRLGKNTVHQNPDDLSDLIKIPAEFHNKFSVWNWTKESGNKNTGYPISMDGHVYRTADFLNLSKSIEFNNLREWEGNLVGVVRSRNDVLPSMACFEESYFVNSSCNHTQFPFYEKIGPYGASLTELLEKYESGQYIDYDKTMAGLEIKGSHQYIEYKY